MNRVSVNLRVCRLESVRDAAKRRDFERESAFVSGERAKTFPFSAQRSFAAVISVQLMHAVLRFLGHVEDDRKARTDRSRQRVHPKPSWAQAALTLGTTR
jgi:hypothetical protein